MDKQSFHAKKEVNREPTNEDQVCFKDAKELLLLVLAKRVA